MAKAAIKAGNEDVLVPYNYTIPMVIFAGFGVLALLLGFYLKYIDGKHHYGLEEPNIKPNTSAERAEVESAEM